MAVSEGVDDDFYTTNILKSWECLLRIPSLGREEINVTQLQCITGDFCFNVSGPS